MRGAGHVQRCRVRIEAERGSGRGRDGRDVPQTTMARCYASRSGFVYAFRPEIGWRPWGCTRAHLLHLGHAQRQRPITCPVQLGCALRAGLRDMVAAQARGEGQAAVWWIAR